MSGQTKQFGTCKCCAPLVPAYFIEEERVLINGVWLETGRKRYAIDYLYCPQCGIKYPVDDSADGSWWRT